MDMQTQWRHYVMLFCGLSLLTAGVVAGGSKASVKLFHDVLDVRSTAERDVHEEKDIKRELRRTPPAAPPPAPHAAPVTPGAGAGV